MIAHRKIEDRGSILTVDGEPAVLGLLLRPSTTSPTRLKAVFALPVRREDEEGEPVLDIVPMPFATPQLATEGEPNGMAVEFRLEMN
jgi:hypothetical protein